MKTADIQRRRFELMAAEHVKRLGARIRARREELGMTQHEVASALPGRVTHNRVSLWERGEHQPRADSLEALAKALDVPVSYFMMDEPDKTKTPDLAGVLAHPASRSQLDQIEAKIDWLIRALTATAAQDGGELPGDWPPLPEGLRPDDEDQRHTA